MSSVVTTAGTALPVTSVPPSDHDVPPWLVERRREAWDRFLREPAPSARDEAWRFGSPARLDFEGLSDGVPLDEAARERCLSDGEGAHLLFGNGLVLDRQRHPAEERGLVCLPFLEAAARYPEVVEEAFVRVRRHLGSEKAAALHLARVAGGVVVIVPDGLEVDEPLEIAHGFGGDRTITFPHTLVVAGERAAVTVVEHYRSADDRAGWAAGETELIAGRGSRIRHALIQELNADSSLLLRGRIEVGADADVKYLQGHLGAGWVRSELVSHLNGKGANSDMLSVSVPTGKASVDQRTLQLHHQPHTTSDLLYKNALLDRSRSVFSGLIEVDEGAHYTDAYQTCRNLLLSDEAEANSMPGLEINADQVKCSHGSTSGQIPEEDIFYFLARGIPAPVARQLITLGFIGEAVERFDHPAACERVMERVAARFHGLAV